MAADPPLWSTVLQKEALDLDGRSLADAGRRRTGAPSRRDPCRAPVIENVDLDPDAAERRQKRRDRAIFERLSILDRLGHPKLPQPAEQRLTALQRLYPVWDIDAGDRAHFTILTDSSYGVGEEVNVEQLSDLSGEELRSTLRAPADGREAKLEDGAG